ncbi:MAG: hypothetical protein ACI3XR_03515 [Eubacteriales bacterium]
MIFPYQNKKPSPLKKGVTQLVEKAKVINKLRKSFRPPFLKGGNRRDAQTHLCAGQGRVALVALPSLLGMRRARNLPALFFLLSFFFWAYIGKEKADDRIWTILPLL